MDAMDELFETIAIRDIDHSLRYVKYGCDRWNLHRLDDRLM